MKSLISENRVNVKSKIDEEIERLKLRQYWLERVLSEVPDTVPVVPTVANESEKAFLGRSPGAWISFQDFQKKFKSSDILLALEAAGWKTIPASLVTWDNYRAHPEPGVVEELPQTKNNYKLIKAEPIAPVWFSYSGFTGVDAKVFYSTPKGLTIKVHVSGPRNTSLYGRKTFNRFLQTTRFVSAEISYPEFYRNVTDAEGNTLARVSGRTTSRVDNDGTSISGDLYFEPASALQTDFGATAGQFLALLEKGVDKA